MNQLEVEQMNGSFVDSLEFHIGGREFVIEATPTLIGPDLTRYTTRIFEGEDLVNRDEVRDKASRQHHEHSDDAIQAGIDWLKRETKK